MPKTLRQVEPDQAHLYYGLKTVSKAVRASIPTVNKLLAEGVLPPPLGKCGKLLVFDKEAVATAWENHVGPRQLRRGGEDTFLAGYGELADALGMPETHLRWAERVGDPYVAPAFRHKGVVYFYDSEVRAFLYQKTWGTVARRKPKPKPVTKFREEPHAVPAYTRLKTELKAKPKPSRYTLGYKGLGAYLGLSAPSAMQWAEKLNLGKREPGEKSAVYDLDAVDAAIQALPYGQQARLIAKGWVAGAQIKIEGEKLE